MPTLASVLAAAVMASSLMFVAQSNPCAGGVAWSGACTVSNSGGSVDLSGTQNQSGGGNAGSGGGSNSGGGRGGQGGQAVETAAEAQARAEAEARRQRCLQSSVCSEFAIELRPRTIADPIAAAPVAPTIPDQVTLADIASFVPARPAVSGEPSGLGVVGMPTNVVASASTQNIGGTLFTFPVTVTFVPSAFRFDFGDGASLTSPSGGASWASLGQAEFTPTFTSHAYSARGTYAVTVTTLYSASVDFGGGQIRQVPGYVEATTGGYEVRVVEVRTGLVDKTCLENPSGIGC